MTETTAAESRNRVRNVELNRELYQANKYILGKREESKTLPKLGEKCPGDVQRVSQT